MERTTVMSQTCRGSRFLQILGAGEHVNDETEQGQRPQSLLHQQYCSRSSSSSGLSVRRAEGGINASSVVVKATTI